VAESDVGEGTAECGEMAVTVVEHEDEVSFFVGLVRISAV